MYAIIKTGGKQYKVAEGDVLEVEHLKAKGDAASFTPLLVVTDDGKTVMGANELKSFPVSIKVIGDAKGDKVTVFKYRPKSGYASKTGHRQLYSMIEVVSIGEKSAKAEAKSKEAKPAKKETAAEVTESPAKPEAAEARPEKQESAG